VQQRKRTSLSIYIHFSGCKVNKYESNASFEKSILAWMDREAIEVPLLVGGDAVLVMDASGN
jgi:hypothetical protein